MSVLQAFIRARDERYSVLSFSIARIVSLVSLTALLNVFNSWSVRVSEERAEKCCVLKKQMTFPAVTIRFSLEALFFPQSLRKFPKLAVSAESWWSPSLYFSTMFDKLVDDSFIDLKSSILESSSLSLKG